MNTIWLLGYSSITLLLVVLIAAATSLPTMDQRSIDIPSTPKEPSP